MKIKLAMGIASIALLGAIACGTPPQCETKDFLGKKVATFEITKASGGLYAVPIDRNGNRRIEAYQKAVNTFGKNYELASGAVCYRR